MFSSDCADKLLHVVPRVMHSIRSEMRQVAKAELTVPQFRILAQLNSGRRTGGELAEWIGVTLPAISRMLDCLTSKGFVRRTRSKTDRRSIRVSMTPKGKEFFQKTKLATRTELALKIDQLTTAQKLELTKNLEILSKLFSFQEEQSDESQKSVISRINSTSASIGLRSR